MRKLPLRPCGSKIFLIIYYRKDGYPSLVVSLRILAAPYIAPLPKSGYMFWQAIIHLRHYGIWLYMQFINNHLLQYMSWKYIQCRAIVDQHLAYQYIFASYSNVQWFIMSSTSEVQLTFSKI